MGALLVSQLYDLPDRGLTLNVWLRWNASVAFASYLDQPEHVDLYRDRAVLELGAGSGLPSIVAAKNDAKRARIYNPSGQMLDLIAKSRS